MHPGLFHLSETLYLFGDLDSVTWSSLLEKYNKPRWFIPGHEAALSFGIAGRGCFVFKLQLLKCLGTGVPFHFHGPGFAEVIYGRKVRLLFLLMSSSSTLAMVSDAARKEAQVRSRQINS